MEKMALQSEVREGRLVVVVGGVPCYACVKSQPTLRIDSLYNLNSNLVESLRIKYENVRLLYFIIQT